MVYLYPKNPNLGMFILEGVAMEDIGILCPFGQCYVHLVILWLCGIFYGHLVYFTIIYIAHFLAIWYIFSCFGILYEEKSGNPDANRQT
jgi:hypothetical protein